MCLNKDLYHYTNPWSEEDILCGHWDEYFA